MHRNKSIKILLCISIVTIILFAQTANVTAINDQGLVWGIEVDDRFDYEVEIEFHNSTMDLTIDDEMYVIINELNPVPDHVTSGPHLSIFSLALGSYITYWDNGTVMDSLWPSTIKHSPFMAYPIGNWSLLTQIFEDGAPTVVVTQDTTILNYSATDIPNPGNVQQIILLKSNGALQSQFYNVTWGSETTVFMELTLLSSTTAGGNIDLTLILGGVAVVAIVVVALVIVRRK